MNNFILLLELTSGICWTAVYIIIIYRAIKDKVVGMPLIALGLNISWEFIFSFIYPPPTIQRYINFTWFIFDVVIIYLKIKYGKEEFKDIFNGLNDKFFLPTIFITLFFSFGFVYLSVPEWNDYKMGNYSAFIMNALMSLFFITMLLRRRDLNGQSIYIAVLKLIGTLIPTILFGLLAPKYGILANKSSNLILFLGFMCFFFDSIYTILIAQKYKEAGLSLFTRKPRLINSK